MKIKQLRNYLYLLGIFLTLSGCATFPQPQSTQNVCAVFREYPSWYKSTVKTEQQWGVPIHVQMAMLYHESAFEAEARPPRRKLLWVIPWSRPSTAYGYAQALDGTWGDYLRENRKSNARRNHFDDANDFMGWYSHKIHKQLKIPLSEAKHLYLAYHEGINGYRRGNHKRKNWLLNYADKVQQRSHMYKQQLKSCVPIVKQN
jgi:hypothetical protein